MRETTRKGIESAANISIIIIALVTCITVIPRFWSKKNIEMIAAGTRVSLPEVDWSTNNRNLLLVLSKDCHFCSESSAFYKRLEEKATNDKARLIGIFAQSVSDAKQFLRRLDLHPEIVIQRSLPSIGVLGTPTLILTDNKGTIKGIWRGLLSVEKENEILDGLK